MKRQAANIVSSQVVVKPDAVLGLSTDGTPLGMYRNLIKLYKNEEVDFSEISVFNLDQYHKGEYKI